MPSSGSAAQLLVERISEAVESRRDAILATLIDAIAIPTVDPPGENYDKMVEFFRTRFASLGFDAERYDIPDQVFQERSGRHHPELHGVRANLLARRSADGAVGMGFYTHIDTMPIGDLDRWSVDPFVAVERDGYIWGRGSADSKGGATAIFWGFHILGDLGIPLRVSPVVALTTDEEIGPYTGLMRMADEGIFQSCQTFLSCDGMANSIGVGSQGGFTWTIRIKGRSVHSSSAFLGLNPVEHGVALMAELLKTKAEVGQRRSRMTMSPEMAELAKRTQVAPVLNITMARAGVKHNVIPDEFTIEGDRRYLPEEDEADAISELEQAIARAKAADPDLECSLEVRPFFTSFHNDPDDPWVRDVAALASTIRGEPQPIAGLNGSTDVAHVARVTNMKIAIHGLARFAETRNHAPDERCRITDVLAVTKLVACLAAGVK